MDVRVTEATVAGEDLRATEASANPLKRRWP